MIPNFHKDSACCIQPSTGYEREFCSVPQLINGFLVESGQAHGRWISSPAAWLSWLGPVPRKVPGKPLWPSRTLPHLDGDLGSEENRATEPSGKESFQATTFPINCDPSSHLVTSWTKPGPGRLFEGGCWFGSKDRFVPVNSPAINKQRAQFPGNHLLSHFKQRESLQVGTCGMVNASCFLGCCKGLARYATFNAHSNG